MDAAEPDFQNHDARIRLDKTDAVFVSAMHTDGSPIRWNVCVCVCVCMCVFSICVNPAGRVLHRPVSVFCFEICP